MILLVLLFVWEILIRKRERRISFKDAQMFYLVRVRLSFTRGAKMGFSCINVEWLGLHM